MPTRVPSGAPTRRSTGATARAGTRERIVVAAAEAFAERGYHGVNLNNVVLGVGLTKGALYYFFPTKGSLAQEIANRHVDSFHQLNVSALPDRRNRLDEVVDLSYRLGELFQSDPITQAGTRLSVERNAVNFELPRPFVFWLDRLTKLLRQARSRGELAPGVDAKGTAEVIVDYFFGAQMISHELTTRGDLRDRLDRFWNLVLPSLRPRRPEDG